MPVSEFTTIKLFDLLQQLIRFQVRPLCIKHKNPNISHVCHFCLRLNMKNPNDRFSEYPFHILHQKSAPLVDARGVTMGVAKNTFLAQLWIGRYVCGIPIFHRTSNGPQRIKRFFGSVNTVFHKKPPFCTKTRLLLQ